MALPMPGNATIDVYRGCSVGSPYSFGAQIYSGLAGYIEPVVQKGRFGTALYLKWTHILYVGLGTDIRDAYNTQLHAPTLASADTVVARDGNKKTAFYVVFVEKGPGHLRVYLDRFQPQSWPTNAL